MIFRPIITDHVPEDEGGKDAFVCGHVRGMEIYWGDSAWLVKYGRGVKLNPNVLRLFRRRGKQTDCVIFECACVGDQLI